MNYDPIAPRYAEAKHKISILGIACWIYVVIQLCVSAAAGGLFGAVSAAFMGPGAFSMISLLNIVILLVVTPLSGGLSTWFAADMLHLRYKDQFRTDFKKTDILNGLGVLLLFSMACSLVFSVFNMLLPDTQIVQPDFGYSSNPFANFLLFLTIVVIGPFFEELFFRATILRSLKKYGDLFAIVFSSLCFGMIHFNIAQGIPAFFMGFVLGWFYVRSRSLLVPVAIHMLNNAISFLGMSTWGTIIASVVIIFMALYGIIYLLTHAQAIGQEIKAAQGDPHFFTIALTDPWILVFFVLFVIVSAAGVFAL